MPLHCMPAGHPDNGHSALLRAQGYPGVSMLPLRGWNNWGLKAGPCKWGRTMCFSFLLSQKSSKKKTRAEGLAYDCHILSSSSWQGSCLLRPSLEALCHHVGSNDGFHTLSKERLNFPRRWSIRGLSSEGPGQAGASSLETCTVLMRTSSQPETSGCGSSWTWR